jgi:hypothetical protein
MANSALKRVVICGVPYTMQIVDGGVLFSEKSGFWGVSGRYVWTYRSAHWYLDTAEVTWHRVMGSHLVRMLELLHEHVREQWKSDKDPLTLKETACE